MNQIGEALKPFQHYQISIPKMQLIRTNITSERIFNGIVPL